ncbi:hypothetical protein CHCC14821_4051 [Bacillus paralicheniformis]|nr:hypothetical protein CHCC14821_4051 [Bacillus paralicheniformis]
MYAIWEIPPFIKVSLILTGFGMICNANFNYSENDPDKGNLLIEAEKGARSCLLN